MTSVGAIFLPSFPPERLRPVAEAADAAGLEQLWLWEDCFKESAVATMAAALAWTERLRVGIGLMPTPMRNAATVAMEAATLERLFPGRPIIGVGHGVLDWMGQIGARAASPLTLLGEHLDAVRALLRGEEVTADGRYVRLDRVRLDWPPERPPAVLAGAEGPKTLALVGARADGLILPGGTTPERTREAIGIAQQARDAAGVTGPMEVVVFVPAAFGPGAGERLAANARRWRFPEDRLLGAAGTPAEVADGVRPWIEAGAGTVVLQPMDDEPDPEAYVGTVGREIAPLLR
ncbi:LLM class flavin-dependent oxidoreductase [Amnibacterium endophyticum]|uniref:LLM class flavin-dependent oxidoreductase n=1 Tax=Amnibacterium endophyticum TaxID=2109337 RepID=A0ABW4LI02_9MICO